MEDAGDAISRYVDDAILRIKVRPRSSLSAVEGVADGKVVVCVHSPPEKGRANKEVLKVLSRTLGLSPSRLEIIKGNNSRNKTVLVHGLLPGELKERLGFG